MKLIRVLSQGGPTYPPEIYPAGTHWTLMLQTWTRGTAWRSNGGNVRPTALSLTFTGGGGMYAGGDAANPNIPPRTRPRDLLRAFFNGIAAPAETRQATLLAGDGNVATVAPLLTHGGALQTVSWGPVQTAPNGWKARYQTADLTWSLDAGVPQTTGVSSLDPGGGVGAPYGGWNDGSGALSGAFTAEFQHQWAWIAAQIGDNTSVEPYTTRLLDGACGLACAAYTGTWYVGLVSAVNHATEMSGSGYARVPVAWGSPVQIAATFGTTWAVANQARMDWSWTAAANSLFFALFDAPTGGTRVLIDSNTLVRIDQTTTPATAHLATGELAAQIF